MTLSCKCQRQPPRLQSVPTTRHPDLGPEEPLRFKNVVRAANPNRVRISLVEDDVFPMNMKMTKRSLIVLGCLLMAGPVLAQSVGEKTGVNSALGISPSTP